MKAINEYIDYCGEHLGIRIRADRCQAIIRDFDKKTWSIYGAPDSYPREQKYWTTVNSEYSIVRLAINVLRNELHSDLLEVLTGKKSIASAEGARPIARLKAVSEKRTPVLAVDSEVSERLTRPAKRA